MAEPDPDFTDPRQVASLTFAYLRRIEARMTHTDETASLIMRNFIRMDERFSRLERDLGEFKRDLGELKRDLGEVKRDVSDLRSDMVLMENRVINIATETLHIVQRLDEAGVPAGFKSPEKPYNP
jgi:septation ring formation regulator EzrA